MYKRRYVLDLSAGYRYQLTFGVQWISEVLHFCHGLPIILVACKKDLRDDPKTVDDLRRLGQRPVQKAEVGEIWLNWQ